ncbi:hypothetical protein AB1Y20_023242 [Prymnesium parvum]|uniref:Uncharacterized protein n=1 Tax=Prymnesium parvum TaxID=97485 RepID=A0AB34JDC1_PRYPA
MSLAALKKDPPAPTECVFLSLARAREQAGTALARVNDVHSRRQSLAVQDKARLCAGLEEMYTEAIKLLQEERTLALRAIRTLALIRKQPPGAAAPARAGISKARVSNSFESSRELNLYDDDDGQESGGEAPYGSTTTARNAHPLAKHGLGKGCRPASASGSSKPFSGVSRPGSSIGGAPHLGTSPMHSSVADEGDDDDLLSDDVPPDE